MDVFTFQYGIAEGADLIMSSHPTFMSSTIDQYRDAKSQYLKLRAEAKKDLLRRFQELANELLIIQRELAEDFDHKVAMPVKGKKPKKMTPAAAPPSKAPAPAPIKAAAPKASSSAKESASAKNAPLFAVKDDLSAEEANIHKHIEKNKKKLAEAQAAGKPTKPIEDRIYELEDELRLVQSR
jgi:hypothetical protein